MDDQDLLGQYLTFTISDEKYAFNVLNTREVLNFTNVSKVPKMPEYMRGIINLRGSIVPVIDLKLKFGMGITEKSVNSSVVVCEMVLDDKILVMGLLTDSVQEVISLNRESIDDTPYVGANIDTSFIEGMGKRDDEFIIILNMKKIFSANEIDLIKGTDD